MSERIDARTLTDRQQVKLDKDWRLAKRTLLEEANFMRHTAMGIGGGRRHFDKHVSAVYERCAQILYEAHEKLSYPMDRPFDLDTSEQNYDNAVQHVRKLSSVSVKSIQQSLKISHNTAVVWLNRMEVAGILHAQENGRWRVMQ